MVASRVDAEIAILRSWKRMSGGYDETAKLVNKSYAETGDIRETMRETRLPFDVVWEMENVIATSIYCSKWMNRIDAGEDWFFTTPSNMNPTRVAA